MADTTWYVDVNVDESGDGKSLADAFKTLNEAVAAIAGNDTIIISAGTYSETAGVTLSQAVVGGKTVAIRAETGQLVTIQGTADGANSLNLSNISGATTAITFTGINFALGAATGYVFNSASTAGTFNFVSCTFTGDGTKQYIGYADDSAKAAVFNFTTCTITGVTVPTSGNIKYGLMFDRCGPVKLDRTTFVSMPTHAASSGHSCGLCLIAGGSTFEVTGTICTSVTAWRLLRMSETVTGTTLLIHDNSLYVTELVSMETPVANRTNTFRVYDNAITVKKTGSPVIQLGCDNTCAYTYGRAEIIRNTITFDVAVANPTSRGILIGRGCNGSTIASNVINGGTQGWFGIMIKGDYATVIGNRVRCLNPICLKGCSGAMVVNNTFVATYRASGAPYYGVYVLQEDQAESNGVAGTLPTKNCFIGNILSAEGVVASLLYVQVDAVKAGGTNNAASLAAIGLWDNNCYYVDTPATTKLCTLGTDTAIDGTATTALLQAEWDAWIGASRSCDEHSVVGNPNLTNPSGGDFRSKCQQVRRAGIYDNDMGGVQSTSMYWRLSQR